MRKHKKFASLVQRNYFTENKGTSMLKNSLVTLAIQSPTGTLNRDHVRNF